VDAAPTVAAISGPAAVAVAHTITLADVTAGGAWTSSAPAKATVDASGVVTGVATGSTYISYTVANGVCNVSAVKSITVAASRSGGMAGNDGALKIYPNPSKGMLTVESSQEAVFTIYTLEGKELQQYKLTEGTTALTLPSGLAAGMYMCKYNGEDGEMAVVRLVYEP
jgi:uncharacterized protein YjdB